MVSARFGLGRIISFCCYPVDAVRAFGRSLVLWQAFLPACSKSTQTETDRHEAVLGYRITSRARGLWILGFFLSALIAAVFRQADTSIEIHMLIVVGCILLAGATVLSKVESAPHRPDHQTGENPLISFPTVGLMPLCLVGAAPILAEGASVDWSAIYMRDVFDSAPFIGGLGPTIFSLAIALGRLFMGPS